MKNRSKVSKKSMLWIAAAFLFIALGYILYRFFAFREGSESGPAETPAPPAETPAPPAETPIQGCSSYNEDRCEANKAKCRWDGNHRRGKCVDR